MKKALSLFLSLLILLTSISIGATALADEHSGYVKNPFYTGEIPKGIEPLNSARLYSGNDYYTFKGKKYYKEGETIYKTVRDALGDRKEKVSIRLFTTGRYYDFNSLVYRIFLGATEDKISVTSTDGDYARWSVSAYGWDYDYDFNANGRYYDIDLYFDYYTTDEQEKKVDEKINSIVTTVRKKNYSDYEALKYIHDLICDSTTYDYDAIEYNSPKFDYAFTAYGALCKGKVVCQGYANAFYRICKELGYNVRFVSSNPNEGCHAWNLIQLDDKFYFVDATWDDEIKDDPEIIEEFNSKDVDEYFYFLVDYDKLRCEDSRYREHTLYPEYYSDDYYENNYKSKTSKKSYDVKTAKGFSNCKISLSKIKFTYNGETQSPTYTITDKNGNPTKDFSVKYSNRIDCGRVRAKIVGKNEFEGYETYRTYIIVPDQMTRLYYSPYSRTSNSIELEWDEYEGKADGYQIQQYKSGEWKTVKTVEKTNYAKVSDLSPSKEYKFRIRAYKTINHYRYYGSPSSTYTNFTIPKNVKAPTLKTGSRAIAVKWNKVTCSRYEIQYAKGTSDMSKAKKITVSASATSKKITGLVKGKKYYVRIRAYKTFNGKKYYSDWSSKKSIVVK